MTRLWLAFRTALRVCGASPVHKVNDSGEQNVSRAREHRSPSLDPVEFAQPSERQSLN